MFTSESFRNTGRQSSRLESLSLSIGKPHKILVKPSVSVHSLHSAGVPLGNAAVKRARGAIGTKKAESSLESTRFLNGPQGEWGC
jgi:hypothetical protein